MFHASVLCSWWRMFENARCSTGIVDGRLIDWLIDLLRQSAVLVFCCSCLSYVWIRIWMFSALFCLGHFSQSLKTAFYSLLDGWFHFLALDCSSDWLICLFVSCSLHCAAEPCGGSIDRLIEVFTHCSYVTDSIHRLDRLIDWLIDWIYFWIESFCAMWSCIHTLYHFFIIFSLFLLFFIPYVIAFFMKVTFLAD